MQGQNASIVNYGNASIDFRGEELWLSSSSNTKIQGISFHAQNFSNASNISATSVTIGGNAAATQAWVNSQGFAGTTGLTGTVNYMRDATTPAWLRFTKWHINL